MTIKELFKAAIWLDFTTGWQIILHLFSTSTYLPVFDKTTISHSILVTPVNGGINFK